MDKKALIKALRDTAQSTSNSVAEAVSAPIDAITWALRKSGMNIEKPIMGSEWMAEKGLTTPVEPGYPKMAGEVLGNVIPAIGFAKAPQIAAGMNRMVDNAMAPAAMNKQSGKVFVYPQDKALATAQRNAAKPVSEGGLGLGPNNTALERAKAMGIDTEAFHGTTSDYSKIKKTKATPYGDRFFSTPDPQYASEYAMGGAITGDTPKVIAWREANSNGAGPNLMPLMLGEHKASSFAPVEFVSRPWKGPFGENPQIVRSRFAAFDPARINENDLLGHADPALLGLIGLGTGAGVYGANK